MRALHLTIVKAQLTTLITARGLRLQLQFLYFAMKNWKSNDQKVIQNIFPQKLYHKYWALEMVFNNKQYIVKQQNTTNY